MTAEHVIARDDLEPLLEALRARGYTVVGPSLGDGAIVIGELESSEQLPIGWTEQQTGGHYRLKRREDEARFGFASGPQSFKQYQLPPQLTLWKARRGADGGLTDFAETSTPSAPYAFFGVRSCDLHALGILDRVLGADTPAETFIVAVQCGHAGDTCFCVSMGTGPVAERGFDLALTELLDGEHRYLVQVGSPRGAEVLGDVPHRDASDADRDAAHAVQARTASQMGRELDTSGIKELLYRNLDHPRWDEVAERCVSCGNCTMVCPTCFCTTVEDVTDLTGEHVERHQQWDSCFTVDYSHIHGGSVRSSTRSRYRQWMTHKLATWHDQFGSSGCVGCGRCISWCPVGIDITEEAAAIRGSDAHA